MAFTTLIDAETLHRHWQDPNWVVVDCRYDLQDPAAGRRQYLEAHIPGARYAHLGRDLSGPETATSGRHPLPDPGVLANTLGGFGIDSQIQVVAYDAGPGAYAARLWWLLRWLGHVNCGVLDGGFGEWQRLGLSVTAEVPTPPPRTFTPRRDDELWRDTEGVAAARERGQTVVDARAAARFRGDHEPLDPVAGHIPGALNRPFEANLGDGRFLPPQHLRDQFQALLGDTPPERVIHSCGSGVTACHNLLAMEWAGLPGSRLYPGSWSEWIRDPSRPVATGED